MEANSIPKIIHDTIYVYSNGNNELIQRVDTMYKNAWDRLLTLSGVIAIVVGIIVPLAISWYQREKWEGANSTFNKRIRKLKIKSHRSNGFMAHMQAEFSRGQEHYMQAISDYLKAIKYYIKGKDRPNISRCFSALEHCVGALSDDEKKQIMMRTDIRTDLDAINSSLPKTLRPEFVSVSTLLRISV